MEMNEVDRERVPKHVAIIMDGNGRWAQRRHLPRIAGHKRGMNVVEDITVAASDLGVRVLTLYAFSTENWKRPTTEVKYLMSLPSLFFNKFVPNLIANNVQVRTIGDSSQLPVETQRAVERAQQDTAACDGMILNFALNYGSRAEITTAAQRIATEVQAGDLDPTAIDEQVLSEHLHTAFLGNEADPELLIRTSGEERLSNFLLWQLAYSELAFTDKLWPDFTPADFRAEIMAFQQRHRRFGGLNNK
ncbi:isoprenyl transferase [Fructilactobacillus myrtifloralis]|uniref:Isoprenyl transferase n=1 Tax=Fructilactobacillus myrtifloralis TaxID=2940301 RepID=A0ABY5BQV6_9LACO|nr:isoprenyl transferase [Fructilactobacillus myrtifloralis]USS85433.1 isoprenyl transferase [Fructilactobacillus myrtifloralis]